MRMRRAQDHGAGLSVNLQIVVKKALANQEPVVLNPANALAEPKFCHD
jgi:hypothetical protein